MNSLVPSVRRFFGALDLHLLPRALNFILPHRCLICAKKLLTGPALCSSCWAQQAPITQPCCHRCGLPFEFDTGVEQACAACITRPPAYNWCRTALAYEGIGRDLILSLKQRGRLANGAYMARLLVPFVIAQYGRKEQQIAAGQLPPLLVPIPLHPSRLRRRRFNQAQVIAHHLEIMGAGELMLGQLLRCRMTASQHGLGRKARARNLQGAFSLAPTAVEIFAGRDVVLVDDVLTTGATVESATTTLRHAKPKSIGVVCATRAAGTR